MGSLEQGRAAPEVSGSHGTSRLETIGVARTERLQSIDSELQKLRETDQVIESRSSSVDGETSSAIQEVRDTLGAVVGREGIAQLEQKVSDEALQVVESQGMRRDALVLEKAKMLLRTPEEEMQAMKERRFDQEFTIEKRNDTHEVLIYGARHSAALPDLERLGAAIDEHNPDIVLHEGKPIEEIFSGLTREEIATLSPEEVAPNMEQAFVSWYALKTGREVRSWDIPMRDRMAQLLEMQDERTGEKKHAPEAVVGWFAATALTKLYQREMPPTRETLGKAMGIVLSAAEIAEARAQGIDLSADSMDEALRRFSGKGLDAFLERFGDVSARKEDMAILTHLSDPRPPKDIGPTNLVLRDMNFMRDRHAMEVLQQAKKDHKKVFITGGASHALTWENAVEALYAE